MNGTSNLVEPYLQRLDVYRRADYERELMIAELIKKYNDLQIDYDRKCVDYDDAVESRRSWQAKATQTTRELGELQRANVGVTFIFFIYFFVRFFFFFVF